MIINLNVSAIKNSLFTSVVYLIVFIVVLFFSWILWDVLSQGLSKINLDFILDEPLRSGRKGGIFPMIVSSLWILSIAIIFSLPLGLGCAIWLTEFSRHNSIWRKRLGTILDVLAGVPSIVFGLFGYAFFCIFLKLGFSIISGGLTLACMMLPIIVRTAQSALLSVNDEWRYAGAALDLSRVTILYRVLLPHACPAITAGFLLALGRATAETAALIFTSGYVDRIPSSIHDSGRALPVHIYDLSMNVLGGDESAYGTALVLIFLIIVINLSASIMSHFWIAKKVYR